MKNIIQKIKDFNKGLELVTEDLKTTFPDTGFRIKFSSEIFIFTIDQNEEAVEMYTTETYILRYPKGFDIELFKSVIEKY